MNHIRSFSIDFLIAFYACYLIQALSDFWSLRLTGSLTCTHILRSQAQPLSDSLGSTLGTCRANIRLMENIIACIKPAVRNKTHYGDTGSQCTHLHYWRATNVTVRRLIWQLHSPWVVLQSNPPTNSFLQHKDEGTSQCICVHSERNMSQGEGEKTRLPLAERAWSVQSNESKP